MKLVFCGTPDFAVPTLEAVLASGHEIALVLTQPDRPAGRKMELHAPPVKQVALRHQIPVLQPERIKHNAELRAQLEVIQPTAILVVAYGRIIPEWMLTLPPLGNLNLHGSLLPKYRGAAPIQWAVANGEVETGVTTMRLDAGLDTGDVLLERQVPITNETTATDLFSELAEVGAALMVETLSALERGTATPVPQDHALASSAPILTREEGQLRLQARTAQQAYDRWRGFYPWPGAFGEFRGKRFLVHRMRVAAPAGLSAGELRLEDEQLMAGASAGTTLIFDEVQLEGKPRMSGRAFAQGFQLRAGDRLD